MRASTPGAEPARVRFRRGGGLARRRKRHVLDDLEAVAREAHQPQRGVREPADLAYADVAQDLRADAELAERARPRQPRVAGAGRRARSRPGGHQVEAVGPAEIEDHPAALGGDARHGAVEEAAGVAVAVAEDVPGEVLDVRAYQHRLLGPDGALHQHQVLRVVDVGGVDERAELAPGAGLERRFRDAMDERVAADAVLDEARDGDDLEVVALGEGLEVRQARHRAVLAHDLADDARRLEAGEPREVDRAFGLAGAHEHAAAARPQREDVPG